MLTKAAAQDVCDFLASVSLQASMQKQALEFNPLTGAAFGAGAGGLVGILGEMRKKKRDRRYLNAILSGVLAGGGLGAGAGLVPQALAALRGTDKEAPATGGQQQTGAQPQAGKQQTGDKPQPSGAQQQASGGQPETANFVTDLMQQRAPWNVPNYATSAQLERDLRNAGLGAGFGLLVGEPLVSSTHARLAAAAQRAGAGINALVRPNESMFQALRSQYGTAAGDRKHTLTGKAPSGQAFPEYLSDMAKNREKFNQFSAAARGKSFPGGGAMLRPDPTAAANFEYVKEHLAKNTAAARAAQLKSVLDSIPEKPRMSGISRSMLGAVGGAAFPYAAGKGLNAVFGE